MFVRLLLVNFGRWRVFLNMNSVVVNIDRHSVFRHIGIVKAITAHAGLFQPGFELAGIFFKAVCEHGRTFGKHNVFARLRFSTLLTQLEQQ